MSYTYRNYEVYKGLCMFLWRMNNRSSYKHLWMVHTTDFTSILDRRIQNFMMPLMFRRNFRPMCSYFDLIVSLKYCLHFLFCFSLFSEGVTWYILTWILPTNHLTEQHHTGLSSHLHIAFSYHIFVHMQRFLCKFTISYHITSHIY